MPRMTVVLAALLLVAANPARAQSTAQPAPAAPAARASAPLAANQFTSEPAAKSHCPSDTIVWVNLGGSKAYHPSGDRFYGKTRQGAYMCRKDADQAGFHSAGQRGRKPPAKPVASQTPK